MNIFIDFILSGNDNECVYVIIGGMVKSLDKYWKTRGCDATINTIGFAPQFFIYDL